jgi:hypothetical protein
MILKKFFSSINFSRFENLMDQAFFKKFKENGYAVIDDSFSKEECF